MARTKGFIHPGSRPQGNLRETIYKHKDALLKLARLKDLESERPPGGLSEEVTVLLNSVGTDLVSSQLHSILIYC
jgi:hypothetical protein